MKDYEDEAFDDIERAQQRKVATGMTDGSGWRKRQIAEQGEPVMFKIFKPTPPRLAIPNVRDGELPWVYDQDPSSGNVASMWVTPIKATPQQRKPLTLEQMAKAFADAGLNPDIQNDELSVARAIEAAHGIKE